MSYSREAQVAQAMPREFLTGVSIGAYILRQFPDETPYKLKRELGYEVEEWSSANSPDFTSPHIVNQDAAVELGAKCEIELRTGVKV